MKFIDLQKQFAGIESNLRSRIDAMFEHGQFIMGPEVREFESKAADFVGVPHCIGVSSGTSALRLALMALGIGPGDEVITTPFSFFATVETIVISGATPVFVDIDPNSYCIDTHLIEQAITPKTKAIMPVDLYGQCPDYQAIQEIAKRHNLSVIEDAAQSFGATQNDRRACSFGDIACTSFFPAKPLGCYGDGGACFTQSDELADAIRMLSNHGQVGRYQYEAIGINARLDTIQAAILLSKMDVFPQELKDRQSVSEAYSERLQDIRTPHLMPGNTSAWAQYTVEVEERERVQAALRELDIPTAVHYPQTFMQMPLIQKHMSPNQTPCPVAQKASERVMSLPFHPYMDEASIDRVTTALQAVIAQVSV